MKEYARIMKKTSTFLSAVTSIFGVAFIVYAVLFLVWLMLMLGCTETHSTSECRDNVLTQVVTYPINLILR